jgi:SulP family sulfate permease
MVERRTVAAILTSTRDDAAVLIVTAVGTVAFDLIYAVAAGLAVAGVLSLAHLAKTVRAVPEPLAGDGIDPDTEHSLLTQHVLVYRIDGPLFFAAAASFLSELTAVTDVRVIILRLSSLDMLDATGARTLGELVKQLAQRDITVLLKGASARNTRLLARVGTLAPLLEQHHVFTELPDAIAHATKHVERETALVAATTSLDAG